MRVCEMREHESNLGEERRECSCQHSGDQRTVDRKYSWRRVDLCLDLKWEGNLGYDRGDDTVSDQRQQETQKLMQSDVSEHDKNTPIEQNRSHD